MKHGYWEVKEFSKHNKKFITCSKCRAVINSTYTHIDENEFDFCPYCGVKMDGKPQKETEQ